LLRSKPGELPPDYVTRALLDTRVRRLPPDVRSQINGVAWFKHDDGAGGRNTPVFLQSFREIVQIVPAKVVKPGKHKAAKTRRSKPVARFEKDYAVAVIPSKTKGNDLCLELEPELRTLVKEITDVGGRLSRKDATRQFITKHGKANSENYQPEKLLRSKTAKALIKAGLLGTDKPSRTSMFWAKKRAV
jgi:hypothetical protein